MVIGLYHITLFHCYHKNCNWNTSQRWTILYSSNKDNLFDYTVERNGVISKEDVSDVAIENMKKEGVDVLVVIGEMELWHQQGFC